MSSQKILYVYEERIPADLQALVRSYFPEPEFILDSMTYLRADEEKKKKLAWAEVVLFAPGRNLSDEVLEAGKQVKLMQLWSSGYDKFNVAGAKKFGIPVANNGGANAGSVAEHTVLLMLAVAKWLPDSHTRTVTGSWAGNNHGMDMFMLKGKRVGIVGFGNIGRAVAKILGGFGSEVVYYDVKRAEENVEKEYGATCIAFDELLKTSDIVTLHLHHTKETENMIGEKEIGMMKKGATVINASRAQLVDYGALERATRDRKLNGAGLDVYYKEPTSANDPLLTLPYVVATPHMAGSTMDAYLLALGNARENFRRIQRGEKPLWIVNGVN